MPINSRAKGARFERLLASKFREQGYDWMAQAKRDSAGTGNLPAVFHKKNNADILVTMRMDDWFELYREWEAGHALRGMKDEF